jgi:hypothetical protein
MCPIGPRCGPPEPAARSGCSDRARRLPRLVVAAVCGAVAAAAAAQSNLGFESFAADGRPVGWSVTDGEAVVDAAAAPGERSLKVTRATAARVARVTQRLPAAALRAGAAASDALRLRLKGLARSSGGATASLWLRLDGPLGPLFVDSGAFGRDEREARVLAAAGAAEGGSSWQRHDVELPLPADVDEIALGVGVRGPGTAWFDALELEVVAASELPPAAPAAVRYLDAALEVMETHALRRAEVDWPALRREAFAHARGAATPAETHAAVRFALRALGDRHSYLQSAAATRALATTAVGNARTGAPAAAPASARLAERIAYLQVPSFAGGAPAQQVDFAETIKNSIQEFDREGVCGWVVDLRRNTGGNLWPVLAGLGPLLGDGELAASVYPDGRRVPIWHRDGQAGFGEYTQLRVRAPYRLKQRARVAVLHGPATASSAEVLAVAFRGRPGTRSFGAATRGVSGGNRTFALSDGASLVLTVAATSDAAGRVYGGPIAPDEEVARAGTDGADAALAAAVAWLTAGDGCG